MTSLFLQYASEFYFTYSNCIHFFKVDHKRKAVQLKLPVLWILDLRFAFCWLISNSSNIFHICPLAEPLHLLQITNWPSVGEKPLSGYDTWPWFKTESDLVTLMIWPRLECKIKCRSFATYQTASGYTQKKCSKVFGLAFQKYCSCKICDTSNSCAQHRFYWSCLPMPMSKCTMQKDVDNSTLYRKINTPK